MEDAVLSHAGNAARTVLLILMVRSFPVVVRFAASTNGRLLERALAVVAHGLLTVAVALFGDFDVTNLLAAYAYFVVAALAAYALARVTRRRLLLFGAAVALFLGIPGTTGPALRLSMLLLGWDFLFASYSYLVSAPASRSLPAFLEFVFVNPALVYAHRGTMTGAARLEPRGLLRCGWGLGVMFLSEMVPFAARMIPTSIAQSLPHASAGIALLVQLYAAHSALASIQIGLCRQLGMKLPERYLMPLGASSPKEFWRRWNTYIGTWTRIYVFQPFTLFLRRNLRWTGAAPGAVATLVSFVSVGLLHDLFASLRSHELARTTTVWFAANGLIVVVWELVARTGIRSVARRLAPSFTGQVFVLTVAVLMSAALHS